MIPTLNSRMSSAELCRANGWGIGTILEGDEGWGPERIRITAIGERAILAVRVDDKPGHLRMEGSWALVFRDWKQVAEAAAGEGRP